jgi:hypothetical protein
MWSARQVPSGLECGCVCPACNAPLIAKAQDSMSRRPHFAHYRDTGCRAGFESAVHRMAKQLVQDRLRMYLPGWDGADDMTNPPQKFDDAGVLFTGRKVEFPAKQVRLEAAIQEQVRGDYIPDVSARDEDGELLIEIRVHHAVEGLKQRRVQSDGVRMIEIDLSRLTPEQVLDEAEFERQVLDEPRNSRWVSYPAATDAWRAAYEAFKLALRQRNLDIKAAAKDAAAKRALSESKERAKRANKEAAREYMRKRLRAPCESMLSCLHELTSPERVEGLLRERWLRDREQFEALAQELDSYTVAKALQQWRHDAWVYNDHPALWQIKVYRQFIQNAAPGSYVSQVDAARWARLEIGVDPVLGWLFQQQYIATMDARAAGYSKQGVSAWFFTDEENALIPSLYDPFDDLFARLVDAGALCHVKEGPHRHVRMPVPRPHHALDAVVRHVLPTPVPVRRASEPHLPPGARIDHKRFGQGTVEKYLEASRHVYAVQIDGETEARMLSLDPSDRQWWRI